MLADVVGHQTRSILVVRFRRRSEPVGRVRPSAQDAVVTSRLLARPVVPADADAYADLIDDTIIRINGFPEHYVYDVRLAVERGQLVGERVLVTLGDGRLVGTIQTYTRNQMIHDSCELGFSVGSEYRGRGYASEAVDGFVSHLHACGYRVVEASTAVDNDVVRRLLTRAGFVVVDEYRRTLLNGVEIDAVRFRHVQPDQVGE
ncbi:MAG: GNAT family N-acetyltransferase [Actinobacteria bacterium]|nr:GNAT family N-acetyltransferase [Actinomycetota bacterium]